MYSKIYHILLSRGRISSKSVDRNREGVTCQWNIIKSFSKRLFVEVSRKVLRFLARNSPGWQRTFARTGSAASYGHRFKTLMFPLPWLFESLYSFILGSGQVQSFVVGIRIQLHSRVRGHRFPLNIKPFNFVTEQDRSAAPPTLSPSLSFS